MIRLAAAMLLTATTALADDLKPTKDAGPYVPSPQSVVSDMLRYAEVNDKDFLIDLGSGDGRIDRKSTRLNSSHVSISYAVFCLKKKKKKKTILSTSDHLSP